MTILKTNHVASLFIIIFFFIFVAIVIINKIEILQERLRIRSKMNLPLIETVNKYINKMFEKTM